ncbi:hypothetical protein NDU88_005340 [Pleurodeles waltl]|uniref:Uncharacterized protein n=1 Tax=Pleurodeles waltl TaxID=8319 RepID=A0AAV7TAC0_PLEWA|nr:hypothetical protein NDU88_005340 [Pleurodeles waltl]
MPRPRAVLLTIFLCHCVSYTEDFQVAGVALTAGESHKLDDAGGLFSTRGDEKQWAECAWNVPAPDPAIIGRQEEKEEDPCGDMLSLKERTPTLQVDAEKEENIQSVKRPVSLCQQMREGGCPEPCCCKCAPRRSPLRRQRTQPCSRWNVAKASA